jgi:selenide,water dikinase
VDDAEPKYGMAVIGEVHPHAIIRNSTARAGDVLVLTKPLGTGIIATAIKKDAAPPDAVDAAVASMTTLNDAASRAMIDAGAHAATDVTGYGLLGHLHSLARASGLAARVSAASVPLLPGAIELADAGHVPGGTRRNIQDLAGMVLWHDGIDATLRLLLHDAQTSGGLLIALPPERVAGLLDDLRAARSPAAAVIGELREGRAGEIEVDV